MANTLGVHIGGVSGHGDSFFKYFACIFFNSISLRTTHMNPRDTSQVET
jgi:hypothetical protein